MATTNIQSFSGDVEVASDLTVTSNLTVDTNTLHVDSVAGRVGIGKTNPSVPCDISGDTKISSNLTVDTTTLHVDSVSSRVGIGKTNPSVPCDISGDTKISSNLTVDTTTLHVDSVANRVGIGKTNPGYTMDVNGIVNATNLYIGGSALSSSPWSTVTGGIEYTGGDVYLGTDKSVLVDKFTLTMPKSVNQTIFTFPANVRFAAVKVGVQTSPSSPSTAPAVDVGMIYATVWGYAYRYNPTTFYGSVGNGDDQVFGYSYLRWSYNNANRQVITQWYDRGYSNNNYVIMDFKVWIESYTY